MDRTRYLAMKEAGTLPQKGDRIRMTRASLQWEGEVQDTFYENGEGGMHVVFDHSRGTGKFSWVCCTDVEVISR